MSSQVVVVVVLLFFSLKEATFFFSECFPMGKVAWRGLEGVEK